MKKIVLFFILIFSIMGAFASPYDDLYSSLLEKNTSISSAREDVRQALLDVKDAKAGLTPTVDFLVTGSYIANPIDPIRVNLGDYTSLPVGNDYVTIYEGQERSYYQFGLTITQPIFTWGKLSSAIELYENIYEARILQLQDAIDKAEVELKSRLVANYYLSQIEEILEEQQVIGTRLVELASSGYENGMVLKTDYLSVKVQASELDVALANIRREKSLNEGALLTLVGINSFDFSLIGLEELGLEDLTLTIEKDENLKAKALSEGQGNLALLGLLSKVSSLASDIAGASVNWKPDLALVVDASYGGSRLPVFETDWYGKDDWSATVSVAIKTSVYDGGKALRNIQRTSSEEAKANINIEEAKGTISRAYDENFTQIQLCDVNIEYQNSLMAQLEEEGVVKKKLLDTGYGSESDFLQVKLKLNTCKMEILKNQMEKSTAILTISYLTGLN